MGLPQLGKRNLWKLTANIHLMLKDQMLFPENQEQDKDVTLTASIQHCIRGHNQGNQADEEIKKITQIKKEEVKPSAFLNDMILYIDNPKEFTKTIQERVPSCQRAATIFTQMTIFLHMGFLLGKQSLVGKSHTM